MFCIRFYLPAPGLSGVPISAGTRNFSFFLNIDKTLRLVQWVPAVPSGGSKRPRHDVNHSAPSNSEVQSEWSYNLTSPHMPTRRENGQLYSTFQTQHRRFFSWRVLRSLWWGEYLDGGRHLFAARRPVWLANWLSTALIYTYFLRPFIFVLPIKLRLVTAPGDSFDPS